MFPKALKIALAVLATPLVASCDRPPQVPVIVEVQKHDVDFIRYSGTTARWQDEQVYFFTNHAPGSGIWANPASFWVQLDSLPLRGQIKVDSAEWPAKPPETQPVSLQPAAAFNLDVPPEMPENDSNVRSMAMLALPFGQTPPPSGTVRQAEIINRGGDQYTGAPAIRPFAFAWVAPGQCNVLELRTEPAQPAVGSAYAVIARIGPSCKGAELRRSGQVVGRSVVGGIGEQMTLRWDQAAGGNSQTWTIHAFDAAGMLSLEALRLGSNGAGLPQGGATQASPAPSASNSAGVCAGGGELQNFKMCMKCGTIRPASTVTGVACSADAFKSSFPEAASCTFEEGACSR